MTALLFLPVFPLPAADLQITAQPGTKDIKLAGPNDSQQLVVSGSGVDMTRSVTFTASPEGIVAIDANGLVSPRANGIAKISVTTADGNQKSPHPLTVSVSNIETPRPLSFPNDVVPIFTRNHCNAGACHAKTESQNGFTFSLFGYDPQADYETLVRASRGRRISTSSPANSLMILKATGNLPHGGGVRLDEESEDYRTLVRWISEGAAYGPENDPSVERIEIFPREIVAKPDAEQQLVVTAFFSDGTIRDITRTAQFEPNQEAMAEVNERGLVRFLGKSGTTSVMVRFQEHVDVFRATLPLGGKVEDQPRPNNFIDEEIFTQLSLLGLPASETADDATFIRRVSIDIAGRLPTNDEINAFLSSKEPNKRSRLIDRLLEDPGYADYFAGKWAGLLRNKSNRGLEWVLRDTHAFHSWIRSSLIENKPFDQFAAELITASGKTSENPAASWYRAVTDPKERMQDIAQVFLGIRMQCAQCHHHPYEKWSQQDYYGFVAFFSTIDRKEVYRLPEDDIIYHNRKVAQVLNPASQENVKPTVPGGRPLEIPGEVDPRHDLAAWIRSEENPYFARVVVNRYWKHFFGRGLVEPEDDIRPTNPATHPELFNQLASGFVKSGYDLKQLVRTICNSRAYQLSSSPTEENALDEQNYARFYPRRMTAEVLLDAFNDLTGAENSFSKQPRGIRAIALPDDSANKESEFLSIFGRPQMDTACECERRPEANLGQSLHLINADKIQQKLSTGGGRAQILATDSESSDDEKITQLYLAAVGRVPDESERSIARAHLKKKQDEAAADPDKKLSSQAAGQQAFEDLIWVLANTKEFMFNH